MSKTLQRVLGYMGVEFTEGQPLPIEVPDFGRLDLAEMFADLGFRTGAEIGVKRGEFSESLCRANPKLHLYAVDPYREYQAYHLIRQESQDAFYEEAKARLAPYNCTLVRNSSVAAAREVESNSLDFVYWDGAHDFQNIANDICEWTRVVRPGGICAGHDYVLRRFGRDGGPNTSHHIVQVVDAYTRALQVSPWFVLGRREKRAGEVRDKDRSFMWVKR